MQTPPFQAGAALVRSLYDGALTPGRLAATLLHGDALFPVRTVSRGPAVRELPQAAQRLEAVEVAATGRRYDLADYLAYNRVAGLLVLKDGVVVREDYELGLGRDGRWASFSLAKSVSSTLYGPALHDGAIGSVEEPVVRYLPALAGSAYDGVSIRQLLGMASGVRWDEAYTNPASDRRGFLELQLAGRPGSRLQMMRSLPRAHAPGTAFNYSTGETFRVGALLEAALAQPIGRYLADKLWSVAGMQTDAAWWLESPGGAGIGGSGLSATLGDYARFARFVLEDGCVGTTRVVPAGWFAAATGAPLRGGVRQHYGYQWWLLPPGDPLHAGAFMAMGIFGQRMYLNPRERLAMVVLCARPKPSDAHVVEDPAFFAAVARALA